MSIQEMSYDSITMRCVEWLDNGHGTVLDLLELLMDTPGVPMHDPVHHYIMPAVLLSMSVRKAQLDKNILLEKLKTAEERARKVLPGFCGWWGCCGSAIGCGIFASVWLEANPKQEKYWANINAFTAACLNSVSSIGGPRCCKRTSYLALSTAVRESLPLLGVDLGPMEKPVCTWSPFNNECRREACPFYSGHQKNDDIKHLHLRTCTIS